MPSVVLFSHPYVSSCDVDLSRKVRLRYTLPYLGGQLTEKLRTQHSVPDEALGCAGAFFGAAVVSDCALLRHPGTRFLFQRESSELRLCFQKNYGGAFVFLICNFTFDGQLDSEQQRAWREFWFVKRAECLHHCLFGSVLAYVDFDAPLDIADGDDPASRKWDCSKLACGDRSVAFHAATVQGVFVRRRARAMAVAVSWSSRRGFNALGRRVFLPHVARRDLASRSCKRLDVVLCGRGRPEERSRVC